MEETFSTVVFIVNEILNSTYNLHNNMSAGVIGLGPNSPIWIISNQINRQ